jgi:hypothetical protein
MSPASDPPSGGRPRQRPFPPRRSALPWVVVGLALALCGFGVWYLTTPAANPTVTDLPSLTAQPPARPPRPVHPPPPAAPRFRTLPPGSRLPSDRQCARRVHRSPWEPRPQNRTANHRTPAHVSLPDWTGVDERANRLLKPRINGRFTGTTDEIIQWAACKWGFEDNLVRAMAVNESFWLQRTVSDYEQDRSRCPPGFAPPCPTSFGLLQIKHYVHRGTYPYARTSTAFNVDYALAMQRVCYEGWLRYAHFPDDYRAGDRWGCVGFHYSGEWKNAAANAYVAEVRWQYLDKPWRRWRG